MKHRVIVEVTFDKRVTAKEAVSAVRCCSMRDDMAGYGFNVIAVKIKEGERVLQAEIRRRLLAMDKKKT
jgi:hypothetical protein